MFNDCTHHCGNTHPGNTFPNSEYGPFSQIQSYHFLNSGIGDMTAIAALAADKPKLALIAQSLHIVY